MYRQTGFDELTRGWSQWRALLCRRGLIANLRHLWRIGFTGLWARLLFFLRLARVHALNRVFDWRHGIETSRGIAHSGLAMAKASQAGASWYAPVPVRSFRHVLTHLDVDYSRYTFIDIGAGKGKAMYLASYFPFAQVRGIELAANVASVARDNFLHSDNRAFRCHSRELIEGDVMTIGVGDVPVVFFLYSPFSSSGMQAFLQQFQCWVAEASHAITLCFLDDTGDGSLLPMVEDHFNQQAGWARAGLPSMPYDPTALFPMEAVIFHYRPGAAHD